MWHVRCGDANTATGLGKVNLHCDMQSKCKHSIHIILQFIQHQIYTRPAVGIPIHHYHGTAVLEEELSPSFTSRWYNPIAVAPHSSGSLRIISVGQVVILKWHVRKVGLQQSCGAQIAWLFLAGNLFSMIYETLASVWIINCLVPAKTWMKSSVINICLLLPSTQNY